MKLVLIGRGRVATHLLAALQQAGHEVVSVNSRTLAELPRQADAYIVAVKDSVLQEVVRQATRDRQGQVFVHTAGSMTLSVFDGCEVRGGVFYPMQTFSKERRVDFKEIPIFIEGSDNETVALLRTLAESISRSVYEMGSEQRKFLHLAAVFACNFTNHCYALAAEVLEMQGIPFSVMLPLIDETARKVHELHPHDAQTGPAVRYDENVISMQRQLLAGHPDLQEVYSLLSRSIHARSLIDN